MVNNQVEDCKALLSELKEEDKRLRLKRRWLLDLPLSERDQKRIKKLNPLSDKSIPEAMLREDDIYYDNIKDFVERVSGAHTSGKFHPLGPEKLFENLAQIKNLSSLLDSMNNKGLCSFSKIVTEGLLEFEETKWKMKRIIRKYLSSYLDSKNSDLQMRKDQISSLLNNPEYFSGNYGGLCSPECFHAAAIRVLDMLEEFPPQILEAMHGRLNGKAGSIPKLKNRKVRKKRELLPAVRRLCMKMLSELDEGKQPSELLVDALSIAGLTLKLILGHTYVTEFKRFSPKVEALQNSIAKAIWNVNAEKKVSIKDLEEMCKKLHLLLGCELKFSKRSLRFVVKSLLIEYLIDCSDLESIPESLIQLLNEINKIQHPSSSAGCTPKEEVEKEVEFLLCLSAQIKQIIWDVLPDAQVDQDFADAYMEEPEDGDEEEDTMDEVLVPQTFEHASYDPYRMTESIGETNPDVLSVSTYKADDSSLLLSSNTGLTPKQEPLDIDDKGSFWSSDFLSLSCSESKPFIGNQSFDCNRSLLASLEDINEAKTDGNMHGKLGNIQHQQCTRKNNYLSIQRACDETAMAIYQCFDGMINDFAQVECLDYWEKGNP